MGKSWRKRVVDELSETILGTQTAKSSAKYAQRKRTFWNSLHDYLTFVQFITL